MLRKNFKLMNFYNIVEDPLKQNKLNVILYAIYLKNENMGQLKKLEKLFVW